MDSFSLKIKVKIDDFRDYQPLLFIGNTPLHTNYPVSNNCSSYRLTLMAHFFDPSPKYGVGGLLRPQEIDKVMITFDNLIQETPYLSKDKYDEAFKAKQKNIEAISISSYSSKKQEVNSRYVNLKFVNNNEFTNYKSPKSIEFDSHNQITALIYWCNTNIQIRMKAIITKTSKDFNQLYFFCKEIRKKCFCNLFRTI